MQYNAHIEHVYHHAVHTVKHEMNYQSAVQQLEHVATSGCQKAADFLAQIYMQGFRVERDLLKAQYWQDLAMQHI